MDVVIDTATRVDRTGQGAVHEASVIAVAEASRPLVDCIEWDQIPLNRKEAK